MSRNSLPFCINNTFAPDDSVAKIDDVSIAWTLTEPKLLLASLWWIVQLASPDVVAPIFSVNVPDHNFASVTGNWISPQPVAAPVRIYSILAGPYVSASNDSRLSFHRKCVSALSAEPDDDVILNGVIPEIITRPASSAAIGSCVFTNWCHC